MAAQQGKIMHSERFQNGKDATREREWDIGQSRYWAWKMQANSKAVVKSGKSRDEDSLEKRKQREQRRKWYLARKEKMRGQAANDAGADPSWPALGTGRRSTIGSFYPQKISARHMCMRFHTTLQCSSNQVQ